MKEIIVNEEIHSTVRITRNGEKRDEDRKNGKALIVCSNEEEQKKIEKFLTEKNYKPDEDFKLDGGAAFTVELFGEKVSYSFWAIRDNKDFKFEKI